MDSGEGFYVVFCFLYKYDPVTRPGIEHLTVTTELARFPGDLSTDPRHVLVDEYLGTLQLLAVPHDGRLHVVGGEGGDDVARCRVAFHPTLCDRTMTCAAIFTPSFFSVSSRTTASVSSPAISGIPRILIRAYVTAGILLELIAFVFKLGHPGV